MQTWPWSVSRTDWNIHQLFHVTLSLNFCIQCSCRKSVLLTILCLSLCFSLRLLALIPSARPPSSLLFLWRRQSCEVTMVQGYLWNRLKNLRGIVAFSWTDKIETGLGLDKIWFHTCVMCKMQISLSEEPSSNVSAVQSELSTLAAHGWKSRICPTMKWQHSSGFFLIFWEILQ